MTTINVTRFAAKMQKLYIRKKDIETQDAILLAHVPAKQRKYFQSDRKNRNFQYLRVLRSIKQNEQMYNEAYKAYRSHTDALLLAQAVKKECESTCERIRVQIQDQGVIIATSPVNSVESKSAMANVVTLNVEYADALKRKSHAEKSIKALEKISYQPLKPLAELYGFSDRYAMITDKDSLPKALSQIANEAAHYVETGQNFETVVVEFKETGNPLDVLEALMPKTSETPKEKPYSDGMTPRTDRSKPGIADDFKLEDIFGPSEPVKGA